MIRRRQFLAAMTAGCAASGMAAGPLAKHLLATGDWSSTLGPNDNLSQTGDLNWRCEVISTVAHNKSRRKPVVTGVCLQPQGSLLAIVGDDHHVNLYDVNQRSYVHHIGDHTDWVRSTRFTPDGKRLVTAGNDRTLRVWDLENWSKPVTLKEHSAAIIEVAISPDGRQVAAVGFESTARVYDLATGLVTHELKCPCNDNHAVVFSPDGKQIATGGRSGHLAVWNLASNEQVFRSKVHRQRIRSIQFLDQSHVISASDDQKIRVTQIENLKPPVELPRLASKLYATELLDDGLLAIGGSDNQVHVWQLSSMKQIGSLTGHTGTVSCLDYANRKLVSGSFDTQVRLWHTESFTSMPMLRQTRRSGEWNGRTN